VSDQLDPVSGLPEACLCGVGAGLAVATVGMHELGLVLALGVVEPCPVAAVTCVRTASSSAPAGPPATGGEGKAARRVQR
jgi:hypothetical protein